ncbi:MAG TPA: phosphatidate cytidylyltransferase [Anaerolineales bacterium]|nr:phosphatidate cytidylyltransferase [Anaerolineales bacterium]
MLNERIVVVVILLPTAFAIVAAGGWIFAAGVALILALAAAEFAALFRSQSLRPATFLMAAAVAGLVLGRQADGFGSGPALLALAALGLMAWHQFDYERGAPRSGTDFAVSLAGVAYLGWIGAYMVSLRSLPDGLWWLLTALPSVWVGDSAAYFVGRAIGRHRLAPRLSPKKSWEGYLAGIVGAAAAGAGFAALWGVAAGPSASVTPERGLVLGVVLGVFTTLGDLGISMIKREVQIKDSGTLLPGHGGALDRLDSWVWAGVLGYYLVQAMTR